MINDTLKCHTKLILYINRLILQEYKQKEMDRQLKREKELQEVRLLNNTKSNNVLI